MKHPKNIANDITFGVEIELYLPEESIEDLNIDVGYYHQGNRLPEPFPNSWNAQNDNSLTRRPDSGGPWRPVEIVSPVLNGGDGIDQIFKTCSILTEAGGKTNSTCGVHVHVGAKSIVTDFDYQEVAAWAQKALKLISQHENALYAIGGHVIRMQSTYCRSIKRSWADRLQEKKTKSYYDLSSDTDRVDRYETVNMKNFFDTKRTLEYRLFAGTLNPYKVIGYTMVAVGLCQRAYEMMNPGQFYRDEHIRADTWMGELDNLYKTLNWLNGYFPSLHPQGYKRGVPTDKSIWERYGRLVIKNQRWNVNSFSERAPDNLLG